MTGDAGGFAQTTIEIDAAEAANGTTKTVWTPQHGQVTVTVQPGTVDGVVTWAQGQAGAVAVTLRIRQAAEPQWGAPPPGSPAPTSGLPAPTSGFPAPTSGYPQPGFPPPPGQAGYGQPQPGQAGYGQPQPGQAGYGQPQPGFAAQPGQPGPGYPPPGYPAQPGFPGPGYPVAQPPAKPARKGLLIGVGAAVAVVLVAGCCIGTRLISSGDDKKDASGKTTGGSSTTAPAQAKEVDAASYAQLLATADAAIKTDFSKLNTANAATLKTAAPAAATTMRTQAQALLAVSPPAAAKSANSDIVTQLQTWSDSLEADATAKSSCIATPGPYADLLKSQFATELRVDSKDLASADPTFKFGTFLPAAPKEQNRRLATGTYIKKPTNRGLGHLEIQNGAGDTTISLVPTSSKKATLTVYVKSKGKFTATGIKDGSYKVFSATGTDYDSAKKGFTRGCAFTKFDDTFKFTTTSTSSTIWQIKLTPVIGGYASTSDVDPGSFPTN